MPLSSILQERFHQERTAMPGIYGANSQNRHSVYTGTSGDRIVHDGIQLRLLTILDQVTAKEIPTGCEYAYRPSGMTRNVDYGGIPSILGENLSVLQIHIGTELL